MNRAVKIIEDVPAFGLCTGCGTCAGVCPSEAITMVCDKKGMVIPQVNREQCTECGLCLQVCPGYELSFAHLTQTLFGTQPENVAIGPYRALYAGHATNPELRKRTQSGGMISALLNFMLKQGMIDGAVVTRWKADDPLVTETFIASTQKDVLSAALSKYIPVPVNEIFAELSRRKGRYAFVGTPCQIHGIRKAEALLPWLREKIALHIGLHCLGVFNKHFPKDMLVRMGVERKELKHFIFRSKQPWGWPCHMHIEALDGRRWNIPGKYSRLATRPYYTPYRCSLCFDKLNELADITFGDCRIPRHYGVKKLADAYRPDNLGKSDVIIRTEQGENALKAAIDHGVVDVDPSTPDEIVTTTKVIEKKLGVNSYSLKARIRGRPVPKYDIRFVPRSISRRFLLCFLTPLSLATSSILAFSNSMTGCKVFHRMMRRIPLRVLRVITGLLDKINSLIISPQTVIKSLSAPSKITASANTLSISIMELKNALGNLWNYTHHRNLVGYDKFDALNSPILRAFTFNCSFLRLLATQIVVRSPLPFNIRPFLLIPQQRGPSRIALFARAYLLMYTLEPDAGWLDRASECIEWLTENISPEYSGAAWGYNFPWQNRGFYAPRGMPNLVVTRYCGDACLDMYDATRDTASLDMARSAAHFILSDLPVLFQSDRKLCLGYVPTRLNLTVVNLNAQAAAFIARVAEATGEKALARDAKRLMNYVESQKTDYNAWYYTDPPKDKSLITHDNYHTANILDAILTYTEATNDQTFMPSYHEGLQFYRDHLFLETGAPKWMNDRIYPHDIRGAAAGIATFSRASNYEPGYLDFAFKVANWAIHEMQAPRGCFYYQKNRWYTKKFTLMGWCNAPMAYVLTQLLYHARIQQNKNSPASPPRINTETERDSN